MKAEIQFLMSPKDTDEFIAFAKQSVDDHDEDSECFRIGDCEINFQPSVMPNAMTIIIGYIAINSGGLDDGCKDQNRANKTYRELRNFIKKRYYNRLSTWTEGQKEKANRSRNHWLGPDAQHWKTENPNALMRLSNSSSILFDIAPEFHEMGSIEPKDEKFQFIR